MNKLTDVNVNNDRCDEETRSTNLLLTYSSVFSQVVKIIYEKTGAQNYDTGWKNSKCVKRWTVIFEQAVRNSVAPAQLETCVLGAGLFTIYRKMSIPLIFSITTPSAMNHRSDKISFI